MFSFIPVCLDPLGLRHEQLGILPAVMLSVGQQNDGEGRPGLRPRRTSGDRRQADKQNAQAGAAPLCAASRPGALAIHKARRQGLHERISDARSNRRSFAHLEADEAANRHRIAQLLGDGSHVLLY